MNWLLTGGCGFIGTSLVRALCAEGSHRVRIVDNLSVGTRSDLADAAGTFQELTVSDIKAGRFPHGTGAGGEVQFIEGDILDDDLAVAASKDMDVIVHLAANTGVGPSVDDPRQDCVK